MTQQRNLIFGFGSGRPQCALNLPDGRLACTEASDLHTFAERA
jgi:hypothetical protein